MNSEESKSRIYRESRLGKLYLIGVFMVLCSIVACFGILTTASAAGISGGRTHVVILTAATPSPIGLAYTIALWLVIPAYLVVRLLRHVPRRPQILIPGEKRIPVVHAKKPKPSGNPIEPDVATARQHD